MEPELNDAVFNRMMSQTKGFMPTANMAAQAAVMGEEPGLMLDETQDTRYGQALIDNRQNAPKSRLETFGEMQTKKGNGNRGVNGSEQEEFRFAGGGMHEAVQAGQRAVPRNASFDQRDMMVGSMSRFDQREEARKKALENTRLQKAENAKRMSQEFIGM